jgi:hypothetical protein
MRRGSDDKAHIFSTFAALFGGQAVAQEKRTHAANITDDGMLDADISGTVFKCKICKKWWRQVYAGLSCSAVHRDGECCHFAQAEVSEPEWVTKSPKPSKPKNGECPVCGTRQTGAIDLDGARVFRRIIVECEHCTNAFYQRFSFDAPVVDERGFRMKQPAPPRTTRTAPPQSQR